jgi:hypothetical protein
MLALSAMGNTWQFIFVLIGIVCFVAAAVGVKFGGERAALIGLGLAAVFFPAFWDRLAAL